MINYTNEKLVFPLFLLFQYRWFQIIGQDYYILNIPLIASSNTAVDKKIKYSSSTSYRCIGDDLIQHTQKQSGKPGVLSFRLRTIVHTHQSYKTRLRKSSRLKLHANKKLHPGGQLIISRFTETIFYSTANSILQKFVVEQLPCSLHKTNVLISSATFVQFNDYQLAKIHEEKSPRKTITPSRVTHRR